MVGFVGARPLPCGKPRRFVWLGTGSNLLFEGGAGLLLLALVVFCPKVARVQLSEPDEADYTR